MQETSCKQQSSLLPATRCPIPCNEYSLSDIPPLSPTPSLPPALATLPYPQVLFTECGYAYLDVRSALECEEIGKVKGSVNIPFVNAKKVYDSETRTKVRAREIEPPCLGDSQIGPSSSSLHNQCVARDANPPADARLGPYQNC